jgi:hypothetical protein
MRLQRECQWILNGKVPEPCPDRMRWAMWMETANRHVGRTELLGGEVLVSTVFLGIDHNWRPGHKLPTLFETMVFTADHEDIGTWRYETWDEAEAGHAKVVAMMRERITQAEDATKKVGRTVEGKDQ